MPKLSASRKPIVARRTTATTFLRSVGDNCAATLAAVEGNRWPSQRWAKDPVGFVREILREEPQRHQRRIMRAVARGEKVSVRSGQKTGKTKLVIWLAIWYYCTHVRAVVVMTAATQGQIAGVLWRELKNTLLTARLHSEFKLPDCPDCKAERSHGLSIEEPAQNPMTGLVSEDGRLIRGLTVRDIEAMAGISGAHMLFISDEASQLPQRLAEAIEGNMAGGGCSWIMISNPVRTEGPFYDSHHKHSKDWTTFHLDSEKIARDLDKRDIRIPGLASVVQIRKWRRAYGPKSPFFLNRVKGEFFLTETGRVCSLEVISQAQLRWNDAPEIGDLFIGVDPAGPGDEGDEWAFCVARGLKVVGLFTYRGLTEDEAEVHLRAFLKSYRRGDEIPIVVTDAEGPIGASFTGRLRGLAEHLRVASPSESFRVFGVRASFRACRAPQLYDAVRDELWACLAEWLKHGSIPPGYELETELHCPSWANNPKLRVTAKKEMRAMLGRSPDRADSLALVAWGAGLVSPGMPGDGNGGRETPRESTLPERKALLDAYEGGGGGGGLDPYGG